MNDLQATSLEAFESVRPRIGQKQHAVFQLFKVNDNLTNTEIAGMLHWPINCVTPRVKELREMGLVEEAGRRECRMTRRQVLAWKRRIVKAREEKVETRQLTLT